MYSKCSEQAAEREKPQMMSDRDESCASDLEAALFLNPRQNRELHASINVQKSFVL